MTPSLINSEVIRDLQGEPLRPDSATLLKALDKLLTVGAYYSAEHEQYLIAARKARDIIVKVIGGPGRHVPIEITAQGLMIGKQNVDPNHRNVRLLHDLLVPLNIARFEIDGALSPEDLRQAIAALQHHKTALGHAATFQEIVITGLPDTVRAISRSVLRRSEAEADNQTADDGNRSLDDLLGAWDESDGDSGDSAKPAGDDRALLTRQFLELVTRILANLEGLASAQGIPAADGSYVSVADLVELKRTLEHLVELDPDPAELARLIAQAQQALDLSRDVQSVDLVFQILKKDMNKKAPAKPDSRPKKTQVVEFRLTVEQMFAQVAELEADPAPVADPVAGSHANQLGIALHLLRSDPPRTLRTSLLEVITDVITRPDFAEHNLTLLAQAAATITGEEDTEVVDDLLPQITGALRRKRPELVARFWTAMTDGVGPDGLVAMWPHLVNDILLGFNHAPREAVKSLVVTAGSLPLPTALTQGLRLETQPALQARSATRDLFLAPLPTVYPVHAMLQASALKDWWGEEVFHALRTKPLSPLVDLVICALGGFDPRHGSFYLDLIRHGASQETPPELRDPVVEILQARLENLEPGERELEWVPRALTALAGLAPGAARPLLQRVVDERKFFFFRAWPGSVRAAAAKALAAGTGTGEDQ